MRKTITAVLLIASLVIVPATLVSNASEVTEPTLLWESVVTDNSYQSTNYVPKSSQTMNLTEEQEIVTVSTIKNYTSNRRLNTDIYVAKTDSKGEQTWAKNLGSTGDDYGGSILVTKSNHYIVTGLKETSYNGLIPVIICLNEDGETVWEKALSEHQTGHITSIKEVSDGGFILTGSSKATARNGLSYSGVSLVKLNADGQFQWRKVYETQLRFFGAGYSYVSSIGNSVLETNDGFIIAGEGLTPKTSKYWPDILVSKTDKNGVLQWQKTFASAGGSYTDFFEAAYSIQPTSDNGFIITGNNGDPSQLLLLKLDFNGDFQWMKTYGGNRYEFGYSVTETNDQGFIVTGKTASLGNGGYDIYLIKTDNDGIKEWEKTLGSVGNDTGLTVKRTPDGFLLSGIINDSEHKLWKFSNDISPPITDLITSQESNTNAWFNSNVEITLNPYDNESKIEKTLYRINQGTWKDYQSPFTLDKEGIFQIDYFSTDTNGNQENQSTTEIKIDKTAPETTSSSLNDGWNNSNVTLTLEPFDSLSGIANTQYRVNEGKWFPYNEKISIVEEGIHRIYYRSTDNAGNVEDIKFVTVKIDKTAPALNISFDQSIIFQRNHDLVPIKVLIETDDNLSGIASFKLVSVTSNQPDNGKGDGNTTLDIQGVERNTDDTEFLLRAEQNGNEERIYTVTYEAIDNAGHSTISSKEITVNQNNK